MRLKTPSSLLALALAMAVTTQAQAITGEDIKREYAGVENYNFFDVAGTYAGDGGDDNGSSNTYYGGMIRGSFEVSESLYVLGKVSSIDGQIPGSAVLGWHQDMGHNVGRIFAEAGYESVLDGLGSTDGGFSAGFGFGGHFGRNNEAKFMFKHIWAGEQGYFVFAPTLTAKFSEKTALLVGAEVGAEVSEVNVGLRFSF